MLSPTVHNCGVGILGHEIGVDGGRDPGSRCGSDHQARWDELRLPASGPRGMSATLQRRDDRSERVFGGECSAGLFRAWWTPRVLVRRSLRDGHTLLLMTQEEVELDVVIRQRIRGLRLARGWSLDALAARCYLSPSTLSRIETGHRRIALDQLVPIARALGTTLDQLVESTEDEDVVIRPQPDHRRGLTTWLLSTERALHGVTVAKMRITPERPTGPEQLSVHPGREWFTVLSGTVRLQLGERCILVRTGDAAEFSTMVPHIISAHDGSVEILTIFDHDGERAHLHDCDDPG